MNFCSFCNEQIVGRHHLAKTCLPCATYSNERTGAMAAINAVAKAIKSGKLAPVKTLICVDCGSTAQCYEHRDYNKPLEVEPVCRKCNFRRGSAIPLKNNIGA
jgi:hypothetical protein